MPQMLEVEQGPEELMGFCLVSREPGVQLRQWRMDWGGGGAGRRRPMEGPHQAGSQLTVLPRAGTSPRAYKVVSKLGGMGVALTTRACSTNETISILLK